MRTILVNSLQKQKFRFSVAKFRKIRGAIQAKTRPCEQRRDGNAMTGRERSLYASGVDRPALRGPDLLGKPCRSMGG